jgi:hypothetical protein
MPVVISRRPEVKLGLHKRRFNYTMFSILSFTLCVTHRSFATTVSQLKICDFSGKTFRGFEVL